MNNLSLERRPRRKFSTEEKLKLLRESEATSKWRVAKDNGMQTSLLYRWQSQLAHLRDALDPSANQSSQQF